MEKKPLIYLILIPLSVLIFGGEMFAWDNERTHKDLSQFATENSVLDISKNNYIKNLGYNAGLSEKITWNNKTQSALLWLREGAELEDAGSILQMAVGYGRSFNHFHNPLKSWANAGLDDRIVLPPFHVTGESSLLWAQDSTKQASYTDLEGNWSWQKVREHFYTALTGKNFNGNVMATTQVQREEYFAQTFKGLGHQMHLVQDAAQPDHVRNDAHPLPINKASGLTIEVWAKENFKSIEDLKAFVPEDKIISPTLPNPSTLTLDSSYSDKNLSPTALLLDTDQYDINNPSQFFTNGLATSLAIGISEYTNANFASDHTIFAADRLPPDDSHYFPYPRKSSTNLQQLMDKNILPETVIAEDGVAEPTLYIKKERDGESIDHFVKPRYTTTSRWDNVGGGTVYELDFYRDEICHGDYAKKLLPRAVGYSSGLLNYFFRGQIEITLPQSAVYSVADVDTGFFNRITLLARNITSTGEGMSDGSIVLVAKYRIAQEDPFQSEDVLVSYDYFYTTVPEAGNIRSIPGDTPVELTFDLGQTAIVPRNAVDVSLQVVYEGRLGSEDGGVAVGLKTVSDPTPVDMVNNMDKICLYGAWYDTGSPEAIAQVDPNHDGIPGWDIYLHNIENAYVKISSRTTPSNATPTDYTLSIPLMQPGYLYRGYILSDMELNHSEYATAVKTTDDDTWTHADGGLMTDIWPGTALKAPIDTYTDTTSCAGYGAAAPCAVRHSPGFYTFRGMALWGPLGVIFDSPEYPVGSSCSWEDLQ
jgi:hypothetical protein